MRCLLRGDRPYHRQILTRVAELVDQGHLRPWLDANPFTFQEVAAAHVHAESGQAVGKVVLGINLSRDRLTVPEIGVL